MRQQFVVDRIRGAKRDLIERANVVIAKYQAGGYRMTLRQLYYQFVTQNWLSNNEKSYKGLAAAVSDGRLAGLIDWDAIEDRGRVADVPTVYGSPKTRVEVYEADARSYKLDHWEGQGFYVELWVEKQALAGVLEPLAERYRVTLMVNKGYSSQSAMFESAQRIRTGMDTEGEPFVVDDDRARERGIEGRSPGYVDYDDVISNRQGVVLYLGDHDPSGEDMVRDIGERLVILGVDGSSFKVEKVALTMAQIRRYRPPPNPAKVADSRAAKYIAEHGDSSWEVDALPPNVLESLVSEAIERHIDDAVKEKLLAREAAEREDLKKALQGVKDQLTK